MYLGVKPSIPGVELYACFVDVELYTGPPCSALVSSRVRDLAARQLVYLSLPGRAERVTKGHTCWLCDYQQSVQCIFDSELACLFSSLVYYIHTYIDRFIH